MEPRRGQLRRRCAGLGLVYLTTFMVCLTAFSSLAVDLGRVQVAKTQLERAAMAAARYATTGVSDGTAVAKAIQSAGENTVDGLPLVLTSADVTVGTWASGAFTAGGSSPNAVRVAARKAQSRGTAVPLLFAQVIGQRTCDVNATVIATGGSKANYGFVGLSNVYLQNNTITTDSWNSSNGVYSAGSAGTNGCVATNGGFTHNGTVSVSQNVYMQSGQSLNGNGTFTYGSRKNLTAALVFPQPSAGTYATTNDNSKLTGVSVSGGNLNITTGTVTMPAGNYYFNSFNMVAGTLNITGAATVYVNGNFSITGGLVRTLNNVPANFTVKVCASSGANLTALTSIYADIQAPTCPININLVGAYYGRLVGGTLNVNGSCALHYDEALGPISGATARTDASGSGSGTATIVD